MKQQLIEQISSEQSRHLQFIATSFPSIFSREDVLKIVDEFAQDVLTIVMEMKSSHSISLEGVEQLSELLIKAINSKIERLDSSDVVDFDSVNLSIGYDNRVEIDSIDYIADPITDIVEEEVDGVLRDFFTPEEDEIVNETPYATEQ